MSGPMVTAPQATDRWNNAQQPAPVDEPVPPRLRLLYTTAERHPTHRADVRVLFGKYLAQAGIETTLVGIAAGGDDARWGGGPTVLARDGGKFTRLWTEPLQEARLFRLARQQRDGIVVRDKPILSAIGLLAARLAGIPYIYWMSFPLPELYLTMARNENGLVGMLRRAYLGLRGLAGHLILYRWVMHSADYLFVQSDVMIQDLRRLGLRHDRVMAVPMGVDVDAIPEPDASSQPDLAGREVAVYLGTLDRMRRLDVIVDAAMIVARSRPDFRLLVIGAAETPEDQGWIERYAAEKGASHLVVFTGRLPYDRGLALARTARIGLSPFPRTPLLESATPTKSVEYFGIGLPVVCNDQPDQARVVRESGGGLCVPLDAESFAAAIERLLADPAEAARMAASGREYVGRHRAYRTIAASVGARLLEVCGKVARDAAPGRRAG